MGLHSWFDADVLPQEHRTLGRLAAHREVFLISGPSLRLGELVATFALAQDNAFGQPLES
jgi:hypothetical protein